MKQFSFLLATILMSLSLLAQTPQGINYQTVIRDNDGNPMPYTEIWLRVSIVNGMTSGNLLYAEVHPETTNGFGLVNLVIGQGSPLTGLFQDINWQQGELYLETAFNLDGGNDYQVLGVTELLTVPFAKYADFAGGLKSMTTAERDELENLSVGYAIYNTTTNCLNYWNGSNWFETCGDCTPQPSQAEAGDDQYFSDETTATYLQGNQPESGTGTWSVVSGSGGMFDDANEPETLFTGIPCETYILMWEITTPCGSTNDMVNIQFDAIPTTADAGQDILINTEELTVQLSANTPLIGNGLWTVTNGEGGAFEDANNPQTDFTGLPCESYTLRWTISTDCYESTDEINVTFDAVPSQANAGEDIIINTEELTVVLMANTPEIGTGTWSIVEGNGGLFEDATDPATIFTGLPCETYILRWTIATDCYESTDEIEIVFDAIPTIADAGDDITINTEELTITLAANIPEIGNGTWNIISGEGGLLDDPSNPESGFTGLPCTSYTLQWSIATDCHVSSADITIVFDAIPTAADVGETIIITSNELSVNLEANTPDVGNGLWTLLSGEGGSFADATDPNTLFTGLACTQYELDWTISTACHVSTATTTVTFFHTPTQADAGEDQLGLTGTWTNLAANTPENGTGQWSILSGEGGSLTNPADPNTILLGQNLQHYILKWEITTVCATSSDTVNVAFGFVPFLGCGSVFVDERDGNQYNTVKIGEQCWMVENLAFLPNVNPTNQGSQTDPFYYVYEYEGNNVNDAKATENYQNYGVLYNWPASMISCPEGWHLPSDGELTILANCAGGDDLAGGKLKSTRTEPDQHPRWITPNIGATDEFGFNAIPGGERYHLGGVKNLGSFCNLWSETSYTASASWVHRMFNQNENFERLPGNKNYGHSVRCVKYEAAPPNLPPSAPSNPFPADSAINQPINITLTWDCTDPEGDPITYDVYFGTDEIPPLAVSGITEQSHVPGILEYSTTYYWKIVANDDQGNSTEGELWSFPTKDGWECGDDLIDDRDGNVYSTVQLGDQCWMAENLAYLPEVSPSSQGSETDPYYYVYDYQGTDVAVAKATTNYQTYGVLYNWPSSLEDCPEGWHLPDDSEWTLLTTYVSNQPEYLCNSNTTYIAKALAATTNWSSNTNTCAVGNDLSANNATGFSSLPGGHRYINGTFIVKNLYSYFWSSTGSGTTNAWVRSMNRGYAYIGRISHLRDYGFSVRCLRDIEPQPYQLNLEVNPTDAGTVTGAGQYEAGEQVIITSEANPGWEFVNWTDDDEIVSEAASFTYTMPAEDITLTANFIEEQAGFICGELLIDSRDGQTYETVQIGDQCWMAENLAYLPEVSPSSQGSETEPYYYVYNYQGTDVNAAKATENYQNYGVLYNWSASLAACPSGWHLPIDTEWTQLTNYVAAQGFPNSNITNGSSNALKSCRQVNSPLGGDCSTTEHPRWNSEGTHHGFDEFGFSGLPGGGRNADGNFYTIGTNGDWWSSKENSSTTAWGYSMHYAHGSVLLHYLDKTRGFNMRCVKNIEPTTYQLILEANPAGAGTISGAGQYEAGEQANITAEANPGWEFINWTDDDGIVSEAASFTYTMPAEDVTLTANFVEEQAGFNCGDPIIDPRDGQTYATVQIGDQCWMAENLAYLPEVSPSSQGSETDPHYYVYDYQGTDVNAAKATENYQNYGALYNWTASFSACPVGWHLPSDESWMQLVEYLEAQGFPNQVDNPNGTGNALKSCRQLNSPLGGNCNISEHPRWYSHSTHFGFDEFGFSAFPGGARNSIGPFYSLGTKAAWWSSTVYSSTLAWGRHVYYDNGKVNTHNANSKARGYSVRCITD